MKKNTGGAICRMGAGNLPRTILVDDPHSTDPAQDPRAWAEEVMARDEDKDIKIVGPFEVKDEEDT
jgi:hypothetical protein